MKLILNISMPSTSNKQRQFMWLVHGVQKGKILPSKVGPKVTMAASRMNPSDVKDFLMQERGLKECGRDTKKRLLAALKEIHKPLYLETEEPESPNPIASSKIFHGDFDDTLKMYRGFEFTPKEIQAIQNFTETKPTRLDKFSVTYSKGDDYGNNSTIVVKKLRDTVGFVYVAIVKIRAGEDQPEESPQEPVEQSPEPASSQGAQGVQEAEDSNVGEEIKIIKSIPIDDQSGDEILTNFLQAVFRTKA